MAACLYCGRYVYQDAYIMDKQVFCSTDCKQKHDIKTITLKYPCHHCKKQILISQGVWVKGKTVFCSASCFYKFNTNPKKTTK